MKDLNFSNSRYLSVLGVPAPGEVCYLGKIRQAIENGDEDVARRPASAPVHAPPSANHIANARYVGSKEHKVVRWWGGLPGAYIGPSGVATRPKKQKTTICDLVTDQERQKATDWVKHALQTGQYRFYEGDDVFPKMIWHCADGRIWFGVCINGTSGEYKGWPVDMDEWNEKFD